MCIAFNVNRSITIVIEGFILHEEMHLPYRLCLPPETSALDINFPGCSLEINIALPTMVNTATQCKVKCNVHGQALLSSNALSSG